jgi:hypothetical protein
MKGILVAVVLSLTIPSIAMAAMDHRQVLTGPYKTGEEVTQMCLMCHEKQFNDFMRSSHWGRFANNLVVGQKDSKKK